MAVKPGRVAEGHDGGADTQGLPVFGPATHGGQVTFEAMGQQDLDVDGSGTLGQIDFIVKIAAVFACDGTLSWVGIGGIWETEEQ